MIPGTAGLLADACAQAYAQGAVDKLKNE